MATCLYAGTTILEIGATSTSFAYNSYTSAVSGATWYYTPWYTKSGYWYSGSSSTSPSGFASTKTVNAGYWLATSKGGAANVQAAAGNCFTVTVAAGANGTATGGGTVLSGGSVTATATPNAHYAFTQWSDGNTNASRTLTNVTADATYTATFVQNKWRLYAASENTAQGTISLSGWTTGTYFLAGLTKTAIATPQSGYRFLGWYKGSDPTPTYTTATAELLTYSADTTYTAKFTTTLHSVNITPNYADRGAVKLYVNGVEQASATGVTATEGDTIRIVATAEWFCTFANWTINGATDATADLTTVMPTTDLTAVANFNVRTAKTLTVTKTNPTKGVVFLQRDSGSVIVDNDGGGTSLVTTIYGGVEYTLVASLNDALLDKFTGWFDATDTLISAADEYTWTPDGSVDVSWAAKFDANPNYTLTAQVSDGGDYSAGNAAELAGNSVVIAPDPDFTTPADAWLSTTDILITAYPVAGWHIASWFVDATTDITDPIAPATVSNPLALNLASNSVVTAHFAVNNYAVTVEMDTDSAAHGAVTMAYTPSGGALQDTSPLAVVHGDTISITCTPDSGYTFEGWYKDGVKIAGAVAGPYTTTAIVAACAFTAKLTAVVSIAKDTVGDGAVGFYDEAGVAITDGVTDDAGVLSYSVLLGADIRVKATSAGGADYFVNWYVTGDGTKAPIAGYAYDTTFTVTETKSIVALFSASAVARYLLVTNAAAGVGKGTVSSIEGTLITRSAFSTAVGVTLGDPLVAEVAGDKHYSFDSIATTYVGCVPAEGYVFLKWQIKRVGDADYSDYSTSATAEVVMTLDCILLAVYVTADPLLIKAAYATGSNSVTGSLLLEPVGSNPVVTAISTSSYHLQGASVTMTAIPSNGYVFSGWFAAADTTGLTAVSTLSVYTFTVATAKTLYAKFAQDDNAVYKWEGGTANKMMEWRSKRFVATMPFNPSAAKIYAAGYPVALNIFMCSSPDAPSPTVPTASVFAYGQEGFRLPRARSEKYIEIEVKASAEVSEVAVATSMGGVVQ